MHAMTAAHRTFPLGSIVRVTNSKTGNTALVRITDRGPFIPGRIIDLSLAAAELHLTASAISHQVARLESQLGVRLFERSAHGVRVSSAGELYLSRVGGALSAIASRSGRR